VPASPAALWHHPVVARSEQRLSGIVLGCDVSNYTSIDDSVVIRGPALVTAVREMANIQFIFVQGLPPPKFMSTKPQCRAVVEGGSKLGGYVWLFSGGTRDGDLDSRIHSLDEFHPYLWRLALDAEETDVTEDEVHEGLAMCKAYLPDRPLVMYTGPWWLQAMGWSQATFPEVEEWWLSIYDGVPDPAVGLLPGYRCEIKQYADAPNTQLITGVDMNAMEASRLYV
jgi:hypothetical protein